MPQKARVYYNRILAGYLIKEASEYQFIYDSDYLRSDHPSISISFPKQSNVFRSKTLFPFFYGMLPEGENKEIICKTNKIDENDHFTLLLKTACFDTIGAITIEAING